MSRMLLLETLLRKRSNHWLNSNIGNFKFSRSWLGRFLCRYNLSNRRRCRMSVRNLCQIGIMSIPIGHMLDWNLRPFQMDICQIGIYVHSKWTHMSDWNVRNIFVQVVLSPMLSHQFVVWIVGDPYQFWTII